MTATKHLILATAFVGLAVVPAILGIFLENESLFWIIFNSWTWGRYVMPDYFSALRSWLEKQ